MKTARLLAVLSCIASAASAQAQEPHYYGTLTYQLSFPIGETHQFISDVSWRGIGLDIQYVLTPEVSAGFALAWNVFYEGTNRVIHFNNGGTQLDISGYQDRSLNVFPLLLDARYYPRKEGRGAAYVGLGIGAYIITQRLDIGLSSYSNSGVWHFGLAPEIGAIVAISSGINGTFGVRWNLPFASGGQGFFQFIAIHIGIGWGNWP